MSTAAPLRLLGHGLDAIIQCTHHRPETLLARIFFPGGSQDPDLPIVPTAQARLDRYHTALHYAPDPDRESHWRRELRGLHVKYAVRSSGRRHNVRSLDDWRSLKRARR